MPPQAPVAHQTEARILKGRRLVVSKEKMADPRKRVALNQGDGGEPPFLGDDGGNQERERDARSRKVQAAGGSVRGLAQEEGRGGGVVVWRPAERKKKKNRKREKFSYAFFRQPRFDPIEPILVKVLG